MSARRLIGRGCIVALIALDLAACAGAYEDSSQVGMLELPLRSQGSGGTEFMLTGTFELVGPETLSVTVMPSDPAAATDDLVRMNPLVGSYALTLSGWQLWKLAIDPMSGGRTSSLAAGAVLLNGETRAVDIFNNRTASVAYEFSVPGQGTIVFARGTLDIDFTVGEGFADGATCTQDIECASRVCNSGTCAPATCADGVQNGTEARPDCGPDCPCVGFNPSCVKINEFSTGTAANPLDEFVELYNSCPYDVSLAGAILEYRYDSAEYFTVQLEAAGTILSRGAKVIAGADYSGATWDLKPFPSLSYLNPEFGTLFLSTPSDESADTVGWGPTAAGYEGMPAAAPVYGGYSIARSPNGADSDNNAADFVEQPRTPYAPNF